MLTVEQWQKWATIAEYESQPLCSRDALLSHFEVQQPQVVATVTVETEIQIRDALGFKPRRKGNQRIVDEEWSIVVGDVRALEDLVLECIVAGVNLSDYL